MKQWLLLLGILFFIWPHQSLAQETGWVINRFSSDLTIQADGVLKVDESIQVDFGSLEKHGIYRDLPVNYQQSSSQTVYTDLAVILVQRNGVSTPYSVETNGANKQIKIGDADVVLSGSQTYRLVYTVKGVLQAFNGFDELNWNVTGTEWGVPIKQVLASVHLPEDGVVQSSCYQGMAGSTERCSVTTVSQKQVDGVVTRQLEPGENMTFAVGYRSGMVPILTVESPWQRAMAPINLGTFAVVLLGGLGGVLWLWLKRGRDWWWRNPINLDPNQLEQLQPVGSKDQIVVEFTPPDDLTPAMIGLLKDQRADTLDITSTIIDLAARGFLTITELDKKWIFGSKDYTLTRTESVEPAKPLLAYEQLLLDKLFESGSEVKLSSLKEKFSRDLAEVKNQLYQDAIKAGYFSQNPQTVRLIYLVTGIGLTAACGFGFFTAAGQERYLVAAFLAGVFLPGLLLIAVSQFMSRRTAKGHELYRRCQGYRLFIATAETYRQRFFEQQNLFNQILPYAMMFGLTTKFAKAMQVIGFTPPAPTWYFGLAAFNPVGFGTDMAAMSTALSTTMASAPHSSGSGAGGFSGGGFGGGGGGSW